MSATENNEKPKLCLQLAYSSTKVSKSKIAAKQDYQLQLQDLFVLHVWLFCNKYIAINMLL